MQNSSVSLFAEFFFSLRLSRCLIVPAGDRWVVEVLSSPFSNVSFTYDAGDVDGHRRGFIYSTLERKKKKNVNSENVSATASLTLSIADFVYACVSICSCIV